MIRQRLLGGPANEVRQDGQSGGLALLWMELKASDVSALHGGDERLPVYRHGRDRRIILRLEVVAVDEVEDWRPIQSSEQRRLGKWRHVVPAHMWNTQVLARYERAHGAGNPSEPPVDAVLVALV